MNIFIIQIIVLFLFTLEAWSSGNRWTMEEPILLPGEEDTFCEVSVKDPSIVYFDDMWHLFFTARSKQEYTTGYVSASEFEKFQNAPQYELEMIRGNTRYGCAPQVFYFEPQNQWYLLFQNRDSNYQPAYSTTPTIAEPNTWTNPKPLIEKDSPSKWIDFWVICNEQYAYLFYTQAHNDVMIRKTSLKEFPRGWSESKPVLHEIHEAVHIYKVKKHEEYHMIYELNQHGIRSFGLAQAQHLEGPWEKITDNYAEFEQFEIGDRDAVWTEMVSHGEVIRKGYNQRMEYEPNDCQWLIQGIMKKDLSLPYQLLPWKLGIIQKTEYSPK